MGPKRSGRVSIHPNKKESRLSTELFWSGSELENHYISSLQTLGALLDGEFHLLAFLQVLEAFAFDR